MRKGSLKKCLLWLLVLATAQVTAMIFLFFLGPVIAKDYFQFNLSYFGMGLSSITLFATAGTQTLFMSRAYLKKLSKYINTIAIYSFVGYAVGFYLTFDIESNHGSVLSLVCIGVAGMILALNIALIFLVQTWAAVALLDLSLPNVWPTHTLFAMWMSLALFFPANLLFIAISAIVVLAVAPITLLIEFVRIWAMKKRLGKIYS